MPPKAKNNAKAPELKVAKRGAQKAAGAPARTASHSRPAQQQQQPARQQPAAAPRAAPQEQPAEPARAADSVQEELAAQRRTPSGASARKVSEGLKQLPQAAYSFVRESYLMLDSEGTGSVSRSTMRDMLASLGLRDDNDRRLDAMLERTGDPITFAGYLAVMGELLGDLPTREELDMMLEAFQRKDGSIDERELRSALGGESLTPAEIDAVMGRFSRPTRHGASFDVKQFASAMSI